MKVVPGSIFTAGGLLISSSIANTASIPISGLAPSSSATPPPFGNCMPQALSRSRKSLTSSVASSFLNDANYDGPNREGALYCRSGNWLEILDEPTADSEVRRGHADRPYLIRGARHESAFSIVEFLSVAFGLVSIRGKESQRFLCMDKEGQLYGALQQNYSSECIFMEEMLENYYNLYSSCAHGTRKRPWYVALRKTGRPRKGKNSRKRRKSSHFLVVHFGNAATARYRYRDGAGAGGGYTLARTNIDGSIQLFDDDARLATKSDHSRFGAAARDRQWRSSSNSNWRRFVQTSGVLPNDRTVVDRRRQPMIKVAPIASTIVRPTDDNDNVISLNEILASTLLRQQQQQVSRSVAPDDRTIVDTDRLQRRKRRRKDRRLQAEARRRERRRKQIERLNQKSMKR